MPYCPSKVPKSIELLPATNDWTCALMFQHSSILLATIFETPCRLRLTVQSYIATPMPGLCCASEDDYRTSALPHCARAPPAKPNPMWLSEVHVRNLYPGWHVPLPVHSWTEPWHHNIYVNKHTPDSTLLLCLSRSVNYPLTLSKCRGGPVKKTPCISS